MNSGLLEAFVQQIFAGAEKSSTYEPRLAYPVKKINDAAKIMAFYLPQFHEIQENNEWWGDGFTEWSNVTRAIPQFVGHQQPKLPDALGFYDLSNVDTIRRQVDLAQYYGIHGFCFYYYWFSGRRILEKPLDLFLGAKDIEFPFCICWANENWTRRWDGLEQDILLQQDYEHENEDQFALDVAPILRDERYIRVGGLPLLIIYRPPIIPDFDKRLACWREVFRREGVGEVQVYMVQGFSQFDPHLWGCDGAIEFPPHNVGLGKPSIANELPIVNPNYTGEVVSAETVLESARNSESLDKAYPWIRGCCPSWDNEARKPGRGWTMHDSSPDFFERWLRYLTTDGHPGSGRNPDNYLFVNAWNEWAEGAVLEPERRYGYAYLNRIARILSGK